MVEDLSFKITPKIENLDSARTGVSEISYDPNLNGLVGVLDDACDVIADKDLATFEISGFGQSDWPVDTRTDLSVMLEQLPDALNALKSGKGEFQINLYEQGVQRYMHFTIGGDLVVAECSSQTSWEPDPPKISMSLTVLTSNLERARKSFCEIVRASMCGSGADYILEKLDCSN